MADVRDGSIYVASGNWNLLGVGHMECAEGAIRSLPPNVQEVTVELEGVFGNAA